MAHVKKAPASAAALPALTPTAFVAQQRRARIHCTLCERIANPALVAMADAAHTTDGVGAQSMADWLRTVTGLTVDHNRWSRHWAMQDNGTHP